MCVCVCECSHTHSVGAPFAHTDTSKRYVLALPFCCLAIRILFVANNIQYIVASMVDRDFIFTYSQYVHRIEAFVLFASTGDTHRIRIGVCAI